MQRSKGMILKFISRLIIFIFLTMITQIGGLIYLLSVYLSKKIKPKIKAKFLLVFIGLYALFTFVIVPIVAPVFGRERVVLSDVIKPTSFATIILNRNYVRPELNELLVKTEEYLIKSKSKIEIRFLDANFPFINNFPLLPHLSHNDGKKIDLSFIYETKEGALSNKKKSISGYGAFTPPKKREINQINKCKMAGYWQYDFTKYMTFGSINNELVFSGSGTKILLKTLLKSKSLGKIFIEPHLKQRLKLTSTRIRYHGCQAVRHDDHIHIQLR